MIYFTLSDYIYGLLFGILSGALLGIMLSVSTPFFLMLKEIFLLPTRLNAVKNGVNVTALREKAKIKIASRSSRTFINIKDFFVILIFCLLFTVFTYVFLDGFFRMYTLIVAFISAYFVFSPTDRIISKIIIRFLEIIYFALILVLSLLFRPIYKVSYAIGKIFIGFKKRVKGSTAKIKKTSKKEKKQK